MDGHGFTVEPNSSGARCAVVLVDDRDDIRRLLAMLLDDEPDFVVVAEGSNGREAIALVQEHHPDLLVLDHDMPVMTGLEALPHIVEASDTRVVLFSADAEDLRTKALELGAVAAIPKATGVMTFVDQLRDVMVAKGGCGRPHGVL